MSVANDVSAEISEDAASLGAGSDDDAIEEPKKVLSDRELTEFEKKEKRKGIVRLDRWFGLGLYRQSGAVMLLGCPDPFDKSSPVHETRKDSTAFGRLWHHWPRLPETRRFVGVAWGDFRDRWLHRSLVQMRLLV